MVKRYLNHKEASEYLGIPEPGLYRLKKKYQIPHSKRGRKLRYDRVKLDTWVEERHKKYGVTLEEAIETIIRNKMQRAMEWE